MSNGTNKTNESQHPEGVEIAIEILQNIPEGMLEDFILKVGEDYAPDNDLHDIWCDVVNEAYGK